jgi:replicative DNA helicase
VNNEAFHRVSDFLEPHHFFEPIHPKVFEICGDLCRASKIASPITLKSFLPVDCGIDGLTTSQYLARLASEATRVINATDYAREIRELAARREMIATAQDIVDRCYETGATAAYHRHKRDRATGRNCCDQLLRGRPRGSRSVAQLMG